MNQYVSIIPHNYTRFCVDILSHRCLVRITWHQASRPMRRVVVGGGHVPFIYSPKTHTARIIFAISSASNQNKPCGHVHKCVSFASNGPHHVRSRIANTLTRDDGHRDARRRASIATRSTLVARIILHIPIASHILAHIRTYTHSHTWSVRCIHALYNVHTHMRFWCH